MSAKMYYSLFVFIIFSLTVTNHHVQAEEAIHTIELQRGNFTVKLTNYGATMLSVVLPDKTGKLDDIILGFDSIDEYKNDTTYFGAIVGRVANRIGHAQFKLNGTTYKLVPNDGNNTLHGGLKGYSDVIWSVKDHKKDSHVTFEYNSFDGEQGFPGDLTVSVTYMLIGTNKLALKMEAKPLNKPTPINLALHTYWNLAGQNSGDILSHGVQLYASATTPVNDELIPTGEIVPISHLGPYDFSRMHKIGQSIENKEVDGYDINFVLNTTDDGHLWKAAAVRERGSGRKLELWTNKPGLQFYTSNMVDHVKGKGGFYYEKYAGLCLETQGFPDSVNHDNFPSQIVNPGEVYEHVMLFRFTAY